MARYKFRLQKVMKAKQSFEDRQKQELADAQRILDGEEKVLDDLHAQEEECRETVLQHRRGRIDMVWEELHRTNFDKIMNEICRQIQAVEESRQLVEQERDKLVECARERKTLEKLRERGRLEHMREWLLREQKETDDIGRDLHLRGQDKVIGSGK